MLLLLPVFNPWLIVEMQITEFFSKSINLADELFLLDYFGSRSTCSMNFGHYPRCHVDIYVDSFLPRIAKLLNFLPAQSFSFTYDVNDLIKV